MINYDLIRESALQLKNTYSIPFLKDFLREKDIGLMEIPLGTSDGSLKGLIMKNNRVSTIIINSDLDARGKTIILAHEIGHYSLKHLNGVKLARFCDENFGYRRDVTQRAKLENEANFFAAEYLLDDDETMDVINSYDVMTASSILNVPVEILDFKLRMLHNKNRLASYQEFVSVRSDFLKNAQL